MDAMNMPMDVRNDIEIAHVAFAITAAGILVKYIQLRMIAANLLHQGMMFNIISPLNSIDMLNEALSKYYYCLSFAGSLNTQKAIGDHYFYLGEYNVAKSFYIRVDKRISNTLIAWIVYFPSRRKLKILQTDLHVKLAQIYIETGERDKTRISLETAEKFYRKLAKIADGRPIDRGAFEGKNIEIEIINGTADFRRVEGINHSHINNSGDATICYEAADGIAESIEEKAACRDKLLNGIIRGYIKKSLGDRLSLQIPERNESKDKKLMPVLEMASSEGDAMSCYHEALKYFHDANHILGAAYVELSLGDHAAKNNNETSLGHYKKALELNQSVSNKYIDTEGNEKIAECLFKNHSDEERAEAEKRLEHAIVVARTMNYSMRLLCIGLLYGDIAKTCGDRSLDKITTADKMSPHTRKLVTDYWTDAIVRYQECIEIALKIEDKDGAASAYVRRGDMVLSEIKFCERFGESDSFREEYAVAREAARNDYKDALELYNDELKKHDKQQDADLQRKIKEIEKKIAAI